MREFTRSRSCRLPRGLRQPTTLRRFGFRGVFHRSAIWPLPTRPAGRVRPRRSTCIPSPSPADQASDAYGLDHHAVALATPVPPATCNREARLPPYPPTPVLCSSTLQLLIMLLTSQLYPPPSWPGTGTRGAQLMHMACSEGTGRSGGGYALCERCLRVHDPHPCCRMGKCRRPYRAVNCPPPVPLVASGTVASVAYIDRRCTSGERLQTQWVGGRVVSALLVFFLFLRAGVNSLRKPPSTQPIDFSCFCPRKY